MTPTLQTLEIYVDTSSLHTFEVSTQQTLSNSKNSPTQFSVAVSGLASGDFIIATATETTNGTSAFSAAASILGPNVVTVTNDAGAGGFRAAIVYANANPGTTVVFNIPGISPFAIDLTTSALPQISAPTTIDGTSESIFFEPTRGRADQRLWPLREHDGLTLGTGSGGSTIKGLEIVDFAGAGMDIQSSSDTVVDNLIGTDGTTADNALGNQVGILIDGASGGTGATIGGTTTGASNTIGFNTSAGVSITGTSTTGAAVIGNFIGTDSAGDNLGNATGVSISNTGNTIGGTTSSAANVIGFNTTAGVAITAANNLVAGNFIGTDPAGEVLGNSRVMSSQHRASRLAERLLAPPTSSASTRLWRRGFGSQQPDRRQLYWNQLGRALICRIRWAFRSAPPGNTIGGTTSARCQHIGFNSAAAVSIGGVSATGNLVIGNLHWHQFDQRKVGNAVGVSISARITQLADWLPRTQHHRIQHHVGDCARRDWQPGHRQLRRHGFGRR